MLPGDGESRTEVQREALAARERCKSEAGVWAHKRRMADAEGVISELKTQGTLARARCRGTALFHLQLLIDCTAVNMKRLADRGGEAAEGRAAGPATGTVMTLAQAHGGLEAANGHLRAAAGTDAGAETPAEASTIAIWSFTVSLN